MPENDPAPKPVQTSIAPWLDDHGWRIGRLADPFGHHWEVGRPLPADNGPAGVS